MLLAPHSSTESPLLVAKDADLDLKGARLASLLEAYERMHASLVCLLRTTDAFAALLPKARLVLVPGAGHNVQQEQPRAVVEAISIL